MFVKHKPELIAIFALSQNLYSSDTAAKASLWLLHLRQ